VITPESAALLVENYRNLRQNDVGGGRTAYRITVRQLESMIRLSEALARMHCDEEIKPHYVKEAARLLRKSIIHVETDDVVLSDVPPAVSYSDIKGIKKNKENKTPNSNDMDVDEEVELKPKKSVPKEKVQITIPYEKYLSVRNQIVVFLRKQESEKTTGVTQKAIVEWYISSNELQSESEAVLEARVVRSVIQKLITKDNVLIAIGNIKDKEERMLVVHPNYEIDVDPKRFKNDKTNIPPTTPKV